MTFGLGLCVVATNEVRCKAARDGRHLGGEELYRLRAWRKPLGAVLGLRGVSALQGTTEVSRQVSRIHTVRHCRVSRAGLQMSSTVWPLQVHGDAGVPCWILSGTASKAGFLADHLDCNASQACVLNNYIYTCIPHGKSQKKGAHNTYIHPHPRISWPTHAPSATPTQPLHNITSPLKV